MDFFVQFGYIRVTRARLLSNQGKPKSCSDRLFVIAQPPLDSNGPSLRFMSYGDNYTDVSLCYSCVNQ